MTEIFDIYDSQKQKTGETAERGKPLLEGQYRFIVRVLIFDSAGEKVLIQKRTKGKHTWPDIWDWSASGGVHSGESLAEAARRELFEELGVDYDFSTVPSRMTVAFHEGWAEIYMIQLDLSLADLNIQKDEVADVKWLRESELQELLARGEFIPHIYGQSIFDYIRTKDESLSRKGR